MNASGPARRSGRGVLCLCLLALALLHDPLWPGRSFWYRDLSGFWVALADSIVRTLGEGSLPLWNPDIGFGLPMLADPGYQVLYPFTWLNLVVGLVAYYKLYAVFHTLVGGVGLYLLALRRRFEPAAALFAGAVWIASGPFLEIVSHPHHLASVAWMAWVLVALDRCLERRSVGSSLALGAVAALELLAGSADFCLMTAFIAAAWTLALTPRPGEPWARALVSVLPCLLLAALTALALGAAQWLPTLSLLPYGMRPSAGDWGNLRWSLHPASAADLWVPRLVNGLPLSDAGRELFYDGREPLYACLYLGAGFVPLVALALVSPGERLKGVAATGFAIALLLALGRHTPIYPLLARFTPLGILRYPTKYAIAAAFFWALLAGLGVHALLRGEARRRGLQALALAAMLFVMLAAAGAWWAETEAFLGLVDESGRVEALDEARSRLALAAALALASGVLALATRPATRLTLRLLAPGLALLDLARVGASVNTGGPPALLESRPPVTEVLPRGARIYVAPTTSRDWRPPALASIPVGFTGAQAAALARGHVLLPPLATRFGLRGSFDGDFTGLAPPLLSNLTIILGNAEATPLAERLLTLGGVDYVTSATGRPWPALELVAELPSTLRHPVRVYAVKGTLPKAYLVESARVLREPESVHRLGAADFDPAREVVLASGEPFAPSRGPEPPGEVTPSQRSANRLGFRVEARRPVYLVMLETWHPGWDAALDGVPVEILRANVLFRAVKVPPGAHEISLSYRPGAVAVGALVSLAALVGLVAWSVRARLEPRQGGV